jgi:hypothetical protein
LLHRQKIVTGAVSSGEQLIAGVVDTGDKHKVSNNSANFRKNLKMAGKNLVTGFL